ncbi:hypothetical protein [Actinacidiphila acidipaludis]|uniref:Integrase catalytic domain-containing protein n=1 Tax=Actinacidiphila acidipaludis TaxID=2873382 RepID=A0ABS7QEK2_9ACTN|nr:hypothetical protein [Streptomyces acidipaludis]MBY8881604.1 hypothetical protein [Streptomyces acidipaludis]
MTQPKSTGSDAAATVTTYYAATGTGACNGRPEWAGLLCSTAPAGAITGGASNPDQRPTTTTEYDRYGNPSKITETANGITRTTTNTYDAAERKTATTLTGGAGTAVPDSTRLEAFGWLHRYNTRRRHSRLGQRSPMAYETATRTASTTLTPAA